MKQYVKPELFFESYELSQNIALCGWDMNFSTAEVCYAVGDPDLNPDYAGVIIFNGDHCQVQFDNICHTAGTTPGGDAFKTFMS